ncbi:fido domain-containing protein [Gigaspora rosea]|uniref:Fido domain-containing protein n=1 Tax=Gigaspora rosea TaxID=44941 RepID=A0A397V8J0_9GLOM|nr:fido domain-containing protein [Gigaspora rosea]
MLRRTIPPLMSSVFAYGVRKGQFRLLFSSSIKSHITAQQERERLELLGKGQFRLLFSPSIKSHEIIAQQERERLELLGKIYLPLYEASKGPGWTELLESGKLWEDHFQPFRWTSRDYVFLKNPGYRHFTTCYRKFYALELCHRREYIGNTRYTTNLGEVEKKQLGYFFGRSKAFASWPRSLSDKPENEVLEIRNHLLATYLVSKLVELEREINLDDIKDINRVLLRDMPMEKFAWEEDDINYAGEFRKIEVMASHAHLTVYPYPQEVPALMKRFIEFRDESIKSKSLHPLIIISRIFSSFNHVHPFIDGNGRVARLIMAYYLTRNGYPPIVFRHVTPGSMATCMYMAQAGNDLTFLYNLVLRNMINILIRYQQ